MRQETIICDFCGKEIDLSPGLHQQYYECNLMGDGIQFIGHPPPRDLDVHYECMKVVLYEKSLKASESIQE